jgi:hypothetical protein
MTTGKSNILIDLTQEETEALAVFVQTPEGQFLLDEMGKEKRSYVNMTHKITGYRSSHSPFSRMLRAIDNIETSYTLDEVVFHCTETIVQFRKYLELINCAEFKAQNTSYPEYNRLCLLVCQLTTHTKRPESQDVDENLNWLE